MRVQFNIRYTPKPRGVIPRPASPEVTKTSEIVCNQNLPELREALTKESLALFGEAGGLILELLADFGGHLFDRKLHSVDTDIPFECVFIPDGATAAHRQAIHGSITRIS